MIEVILLAIALAMDAFAVAIGLGAKSQKQSKQYVARLAMYAALYFGIAQGVMPLIGYLLGAVLLGWLAAAAPWIGGMILIGLGGKMLYEVFTSDGEDAVDSVLHLKDDTNDIVTATNNGSNANNSVTNRTMLTLAIAMSIDAMAAGFT